MATENFDLEQFCRENGLNIPETAKILGMEPASFEEADTIEHFIKAHNQSTEQLTKPQFEILRGLLRKIDSLGEFVTAYDALNKTDNDTLVDVFYEIFDPFAKNEWEKLTSFTEMKDLHTKLTAVFNDQTEDAFREKWITFITKNDEAKYLWTGVFMTNIESPMTPALMKKWASLNGYEEKK